MSLHKDVAKLNEILANAGIVGVGYLHKVLGCRKAGGALNESRTQRTAWVTGQHTDEGDHHGVFALTTHPATRDDELLSRLSNCVWAVHAQMESGLDAWARLAEAVKTQADGNWDAVASDITDVLVHIVDLYTFRSYDAFVRAIEALDYLHSKASPAAIEKAHARIIAAHADGQQRREALQATRQQDQARLEEQLGNRSDEEVRTLERMYRAKPQASIKEAQ